MINLLFQVENNDFRKEINSKLYPKYVYQSVSKLPKSAKKEAFLNIINRFSTHFYQENLSRKRGYCFFYIKKSNINSQKGTKKIDSSFRTTLRLDKNGLEEVLKRKDSERERL